ncbi:hypothetical protein [Bacillus mycoides]|uniref:hypothetical protein n=1 Tax=Bacillus mycoides TaxID=1405 RepID=UPI001F457301|nr:hypothetical protein [Bacillus mycoides]MED1626525.1 hypothetical protein [Bacillus mycoides]
MREMYTNVNEVGLKLYNLLDGKLIYSEIEPTVYRLEIKWFDYICKYGVFFRDIDVKLISILIGKIILLTIFKNKSL